MYVGGEEEEDDAVGRGVPYFKKLRTILRGSSYFFVHSRGAPRIMNRSKHYAFQNKVLRPLTYKNDKERLLKIYFF